MLLTNIRSYNEGIIKDMEMTDNGIEVDEMLKGMI